MSKVYRNLPDDYMLVTTSHLSEFAKHPMGTMSLVAMGALVYDELHGCWYPAECSLPVDLDAARIAVPAWARKRYQRQLRRKQIALVGVIIIVAVVVTGVCIWFAGN